MKKLLTILFLLPLFLQAQDKGITNWPWSLAGRYENEVSYDTTVIFKGIDTLRHTHFFVSEPAPSGMEYICTVCLWDFRVTETKKIIDRFSRAKSRVDKIKKSDGIEL